MPRKAIGSRPLTAAERQARRRMRKAEIAEMMHAALQEIISAKTIRDARQIAAEALDGASTNRRKR